MAGEIKQAVSLIKKADDLVYKRLKHLILTTSPDTNTPEMQSLNNAHGKLMAAEEELLQIESFSD